jgi:hypothetical protein
MRGFLRRSWKSAATEGPAQKRATGSAMARGLGERPREESRRRSPEGPARGAGCGGATGPVLEGAQRPEGAGPGGPVPGRERLGLFILWLFGNR